MVAIGEDAFSPYASRIDQDLAGKRNKIKSVTIPNSVKHVDDSAFRGCKNLITISVEGELDTTGFIHAIKGVSKKNLVVEVNKDSGFRKILVEFIDRNNESRKKMIG